MEKDYAIRFAALAHPQRLSVLSLLLRRYPDAVPAGEVARAMNLKANTLSHYLSDLLSAGFITQQRQGTSLRYAADPNSLGGLMTGFAMDCCRGRADISPQLRSLQTNEATMTYNVLFICTGNSARSIFAETILRDLGGDQFNAYSAGTRPASELNPLAVSMLQGKGHDTSGLSAKHISTYQGEDAPQMDFVFTVCDRAANEECPAWHGQPVTGHWSTPDPVKAEGVDAERMLAFQTAYGMLRNRIQAFAALPFDTLDRLSLQNAVDDIARKDLS